MKDILRRRIDVCLLRTVLFILLSSHRLQQQKQKAIAFATAAPCAPRLLRHRSRTHGHPRRRVAGPQFKLRPPNQYAPASDFERQSTKSVAAVEIATGHGRAQPEDDDARAV
jgi:hypothetical protein